MIASLSRIKTISRFATGSVAVGGNHPRASCRLAALFLVLPLLASIALAQKPEEDLASIFGGSPQHWAGFCQQIEDEPPPLWSLLGDTHYDGGSRYPDYRDVSHNLKVLQTLQFFLSVITNLTGKIEDGQQSLEQYDIQTSLGDIPQSIGHCVCVTQCKPAEVLDQVDSLLKHLVDDGQIEKALSEFLNQQLEGALQDLNKLLDDLEKAPSGLEAALGGAIDDSIRQRMESALAQMPSGAAAQCNLNAALGDVKSSAGKTAQQLREEFQKDIQNLRGALQIAVDLKSGVLPKLRDEVVQLRGKFKGVKGIRDLGRVDWKEIVEDLGKLTDEVTAEVDKLTKVIGELKTSWKENRYKALAQQAYQQAIDSLEKSQQACLDAIQDPASYLPGFGPDDFEQGLASDLEAAVTKNWELSKGVVGDTGQKLADRVSGAALSGFAKSFLAMKTDIVASVASSCYQRASRPECWDFCKATSGKDFFWLPVDFQQDPKKAAAAGALFALRQAGWLDQVSDWLKNKKPDFLEKFSVKLQKLTEALGEGLEYVDKYSEGYHLGAYSRLRPDLHQCVGYAGHGAYAQMGGLGGKKFSLGARYSSHNLSRERRVQFRSGGFAASAFGRDLSLAPTLELDTQIDGFKLWNQSRPLGIPLPPAIQLSDSEKVIQKFDVFNVVPQDFDVSKFNLGATIVRDLMPSRTDKAASPQWPRPGVAEAWEDKSAAVFSLGLNLDFKMDPKTRQLPAIPIITNILTATPRLGLSAGIEWTHQANFFRDRIQEMVNKGLSGALQIQNKDFERDQHPFQAPDLSADNRTAVFVEPSVGLDVFLGFQVWKVHIGAGARTDLALNLRPGGQGGVIDLDSSLSDAVLASNPPIDAPCKPVWKFEETTHCSNQDFSESTGKYATQPLETSGSCCIKVAIQGRLATEQSFCLDDWTGLDASVCEKLNAATVGKEKLREISSGLRKFASKLSSKLDALVDEADQFSVTTVWNGKACSESSCGKKPLFTTAGLNIRSLSDCESHGYCVRNGEIQHDTTFEACEGEPSGSRDAGSPAGIGGSGRQGKFTPYSVRSGLKETLEGWQGAGCHPLQHGFPSACACQSDNHCAPGEKCSNGECAAAQSSQAACLATADMKCPAGRKFLEGACALTCQADGDCAGGLVCSEKVCAPPHGIPYAQQVRWGMDRNQAPLHTISSYAMSDFLATLLLKVNLYVEASFKLFRKPKIWPLLDFNRGFDLGSTWKGWYQPGLEVQYQHECEDPALLRAPLVTNRFPRSATYNPALETAGVKDPTRQCKPFQGGGVCRYSVPPPMESFDNPKDFTRGNAGDTIHFLQWCSQDMPGHVEDPDPTGNDQIEAAAADTSEWGEEVALDVWAQNQVCVDGKVWNQWLGDLGPKRDRQGNLLDGGALAETDCVYEDPKSGRRHTFPCREIGGEMLRIWGCLDADRNAWAVALAGQFPEILKSDPDRGKTVFDLDKMFDWTPELDPNLGLVQDFPYLAANMKPAIRFAGSTPFENRLGERWLEAVDQCFGERFEDPAETACECGSDSGCDVEAGEICAGGRCQTAKRTDDRGHCLRPDCSPVYLQKQCPIVSLGVSVGLCCGDGVIQRTELYAEECDDGPDGSESCSASCKDLATLGACCEGTGACLEAVSAQACESGSWHPGKTCEAVGICARELQGACCSVPGRCHDTVSSKCENAAFHAGLTCEEINSCRLGNPRGQCVAKSPSMVAWWPLDEPAGDVAQEFVGGIEGRLVNGATRGAGKVSGASIFDGVDDYIEVPDHPRINFGDGDFSIEFWLKVAGGQSSGVQVILDKRDAAPRGYHVYLSSGRIGLQLALGRRKFSNYTSSIDVTDGQWHHVAVTVDRDHPQGIRFYADGKQVGPAADPTALSGSLDNSAPLRVGVRGTLSGYFRGALDEIGLYDRALEPAVIEKIHAADFAGKCKCAKPPAGLAAWWPFDEPKGEQTVDRLSGRPGNLLNGVRRGPAFVDRGLAFDGIDDYFQTPDRPELNFGTGDFTIDFWVLASTAQATGVRAVLDKRDATPRGFHLYLASGRLGLQLADGPRRYANYTSSIDLADGRWHHVAVTVDRDSGQGIRFYLDGRETGTSFDPRPRSGSLDNSAPLRLASRSASRDGLFEGMLDELELFRRALTPSEIKRIFSAGRFGKCKF